MLGEKDEQWEGVWVVRWRLRKGEEERGREGLVLSETITLKRTDKR